MKRLLLVLLAAAGSASAESAEEAKRREEIEEKAREAARKERDDFILKYDADRIAEAWTRRGKDNEEAKDAAYDAAQRIKKRYASLLDPAATMYRFPESSSPEDRARSLEILKKRIAIWGGKDARVICHGGRDVILLMSAQDLASLGPDERRAAGWPGPLEFRLEASEADVASWKESGQVPAGTTVFPMKGQEEKFLALDTAVADSSGVAEAKAVLELDSNRPALSITLTAEGAKKLEKATADNVGRRMAIVFGDQVILAPVIMSKISGGLQVSGNLDKAWIDRVAATFSAGTLPCPLEEIGCVSPANRKPGEDPWAAEPSGTFGDRMLSNNLVHAILEDLLRDRQPEAYAAILKELQGR